jgi:hypothetical protein
LPFSCFAEIFGDGEADTACFWDGFWVNAWHQTCGIRRGYILPPVIRATFISDIMVCTWGVEQSWTEGVGGFISGAEIFGELDFNHEGNRDRLV